MRTWQLQAAKAHLSELVKKAMTNEPQEITLHGEPAVIVIAKSEYDKMIKPQISFVDFIRQSPLANSKIKFSRNRSRVRKIKL